MKLSDLLPPDPEDLLALEPEEIAFPLLRYLAWREDEPGQSGPNQYNLSIPSAIPDYPQPSHARVSRALMEAWGYLEREGLLAMKPGEKGWSFVTRRGRAIVGGDERSWHEFRSSQLLPRDLLHPTIRAAVLPDFVRGDFESAVFKAFKAVEVAVREAAGLPNGEYGTALMRKAFGEKGPLADDQAERSERDAMGHLFAGAIGLLKNPLSHRYTGASDPAATIEQ